MKIQLSVSDQFYDEIKEKLIVADFEIDEDGPFLLSEKERFASEMIVKDQRGDKIRIHTEDIVFIESFGHSVMIHTVDGNDYSVSEQLYSVNAKLDDSKFIRVSNSAIIAKKQIKKIRAALSMKFVLTMSDGALVDVTRSYYSAFKSFMGI